MLQAQSRVVHEAEGALRETAARAEGVVQEAKAALENGGAVSLGSIEGLAKWSREMGQRLRR